MKNQLYLNPVLGHLNNATYEKVVKKLKRQIGSGDIYIGKTGRDPMERFKEHKKKNSNWKKMIVLYASKSKKYVENLEYDLVYRTFEFNKNKVSGGGGPLSADNKLNYLYVLVG